MEAFANLNLLGMHGLERLSQKKKRITGVSKAHAGIVSTCFVYQVQLADYRQLSEVFRLLKQNRHIATAAINHPTPTVYPSISLASFLQDTPYDSCGCTSLRDLALRFQVPAASIS